MIHKEITDSEIKALLLDVNSKENAFRFLINKYQKRLYWHIRKMVLSHDDSDDLIQNTFIKAWRNIDKFRGDSTLYTWLYRIATNETLTFINKKKQYHPISIDDIQNQIESTLINDPYFDGSEIEIKLQKCLAFLPEKQRLVFNMKYFDEMKYEEISEILDTSVGALKASYHHATKKIEAFLKEEI